MIRSGLVKIRVRFLLSRIWHRVYHERMLSLVIVDDEMDHLSAIKSLVDWPSIGLKLVATASDGREGLAAVRRHQADILIADIHMPQMTGLELAEAVRKECPHTKVIFLSGHDEFEYIRSALRISAHDYLLKPVSAENLISTVRSAASSRWQALHAAETETLARQRLADSFPLLRERYVADALTGRMPTSQLLEKVEYLQLQPGFPPWQVLLIKLPSVKQSTEDQELDRVALVQTLVALESLRGRFMHAWTSESELALVIGSASPERPTQPQELEELSQHAMWRYRGRGLAHPLVGVSREVLALDNLRAAFVQAEEAVTLHLAVEPGQLIRHSDVVTAALDPLFYDETESELVKLVQTGNAPECSTLIRSWYFSASRQTPEGTVLKSWVASLLLAAQRTAARFAGESFPGGPALSLTWQAVSTLDSGDDLVHYAVSRCQEFALAVAAAAENRTSSLARRIKLAIEERYAENLTLAEFADLENLTPYYIGTVFRREFGLTFSDFLTRTRMNQARDLVAATSMKTQEIAALVGFSNVSYFCSVFRNHFGVSPTRLRDSSARIET